MALNTAVALPISWPVPLASANFSVVATPENDSLLGLDIAVKAGTRTTTGCTLTMRNGLIALLVNAGFIHVQVILLD
jgi:hypothetical protein